MSNRSHHHYSPSTRVTLARSGQRHKQAQGIIRNHVISAMSVSLLPIPVVDGILLVNIQLNLISRLADHYGIPLANVSRTILTSLIGGSLPVLTMVASSSLLKFIPGIGSLTGNAALSTLSGATTHATGKVFMDHFEAGGTLINFCPAALQRQFRFEFSHSRAAVQQMKAVASL